MAAEYSANALQTVAAGQSVIFTESPVPCGEGLIYHRDESSAFLLANDAGDCGCSCGCGAIWQTRYQVAFHANIAVPADGDVEEIQLALVVDGEVDPSSIMRVTPAATEEFFNVGAEILVSVPSLCGCTNVSVRNTSTQAVEVQNANIVFSYLGVFRAR